MLLEMLGFMRAGECKLTTLAPCAEIGLGRDGAHRIPLRWRIHFLPIPCKGPTSAIISHISSGGIARQHSRVSLLRLA